MATIGNEEDFDGLWLGRWLVTWKRWSDLCCFKKTSTQKGMFCLLEFQENKNTRKWMVCLLMFQKKQKLRHSTIFVIRYKSKSGEQRSVETAIPWTVSIIIPYKSKSGEWRSVENIDVLIFWLCFLGLLMFRLTHVSSFMLSFVNQDILYEASFYREVWKEIWKWV